MTMLRPLRGSRAADALVVPSSSLQTSFDA